MQGDHAPAEPLVLQRPAQESCADDRLAVVREAQRAGVSQLGHLGQLLAMQAAGHGGHEGDGHPRGGGCVVAQRAQDGRAIHRRVGVGHGHDRAVAAGRGSRRAALQVLLVLLAGRAHVHVGIHEGGQQVPAGALPRLGARRDGQRSRSAELGDDPGADQDVARLVEAGARVEHVRRADERVRRRLQGADQRLRHAATAAASRCRLPTVSS